MALRNTYFESNKVYEPLPIPEQPGYVPPVVPVPPEPSPGSEPDIPRPVLTGNVECILYINSSENNKVDKELDDVATFTLLLKDSVDIFNPEIIINSSTDLTTVNYMKLGDRYYYAHVELLPSGSLYRIKGECDALMSFKDQIRQQTAIIGRNQNSYNRYLQDNRIKLNSYEQVKTLPFSGGFSKTLYYYLITIGGASE